MKQPQLPAECIADHASGVEYPVIERGQDDGIGIRTAVLDEENWARAGLDQFVIGLREHQARGTPFARRLCNEQAGLAAEHLPDDAFVTGVVPPYACVHGYTPCPQSFGSVFELLATTVNELMDVLLGSACSEPSRSSDVRIKDAVIEFELCAKPRGELDNLAHLDGPHAARGSDRKHDVTPSHLPSRAESAREMSPRDIRSFRAPMAIRSGRRLSVQMAMAGSLRSALAMFHDL